MQLAGLLFWAHLHGALIFTGKGYRLHGANWSPLVNQLQVEVNVTSFLLKMASSKKHKYHEVDCGGGPVSVHEQ